MVFFVISGYLIGGLALTRYKSRGFDLTSYTIHRFSRIYTVLIPALMIGAALDLIGLHFFNHSQIYTFGSQYKTSSLEYAVTDNLNFKTLLANLAMLQGVLTKVLGSNGPLWSLANEWWYYCMFAVIAILVLVVILPLPLTLLGSVWLLGVAGAIYGQRWAWRPPVGLALGAFVAAVVIARVGDHSETTIGFNPMSILRAFGVGLGFVLLLLAFDREGSSLPFASVQERLAGFSYTLYLVHFPMMVVCVAAIHDLLGVPFLQQPSLSSWVYVLAMMVVVTGYAWLVSRLTEVHTPQVRDLLQRLLSR